MKLVKELREEVDKQLQKTDDEILRLSNAYESASNEEKAQIVAQVDKLYKTRTAAVKVDGWIDVLESGTNRLAAWLQS